MVFFLVASVFFSRVLEASAVHTKHSHCLVQQSLDEMTRNDEEGSDLDLHWALICTMYHMSGECWSCNSWQFYYDNDTVCFSMRICGIWIWEIYCLWNLQNICSISRQLHHWLDSVCLAGKVIYWILLRRFCQRILDMSCQLGTGKWNNLGQTINISKLQTSLHRFPTCPYISINAL